MTSVELTADTVAEADAVVIVTDHGDIDYEMIGRDAMLVVDTRGIMRGVPSAARVVGISGVELEQSALAL